MSIFSSITSLGYTVEIGAWTGKELKKEFLSYTMDVSADRGFFDRNLRNPKLVEFAAMLAPAYVRFGGSGADRLSYFTDDACPGEPHRKCYDESQIEGAGPKSEPRCLNYSLWTDVRNFATKVNAKLVFGVNGYGKVEDIKKFLNAVSIDVVEIGNEMYTEEGPTPDLCTTMQGNLSRAVQAAFPSLPLAGPDSGPPIHLDYLRQLNDLFAYTVHDYPLDDDVLLRDIPYFPPKAFVDVDEVKRWRQDLDNAGFSKTQLWIGEGGGMTSGGQAGITDSFASAQWFLDSLGAYALGGVDIFCRQDLIGANYGLLRDACPYGGLEDDDFCDPTFDPVPNPDFWAALLWKSIMGPRPHLTTVRGRHHLRAYAHSSSTDLGVVLINTHLTVPASVTLRSNYTKKRTDWHLTSPNVSSSVVYLNGVEINSSRASSLAGVSASLDDPLIVAPRSYSFILLE